MPNSIQNPFYILLYSISACLFIILANRMPPFCSIAFAAQQGTTDFTEPLACLLTASVSFFALTSIFTCGEASRSIGAQFLLLLLLLEKFQIGGHRARITGQFNVIDHSELKYEVSSPPGGATWEIGQLFWPF